MALRANNRVFGLKIETTPGVDAVPVSPTDIIDLASLDVQAGLQNNEIEELTSALDTPPPVPGPTIPTGTIRVQLKGAATPTTTPQIAPLLRIAGLLQTDDAVIPASGTTTAASGTATTFVIDRTAGSGTQWSATNDAYVGRVVQLAGNPSTPVICYVVGYTVSGNNATVTVDQTFSPVLSSATTAVLLAGKRYSPHSGVIPTATGYDWLDGILTRLLGTMADLSVSGKNGTPWELSGSLRSTFPAVPRSDVALPSYTPSRTFRPPSWKNGAFSYNLVRATGSAFSMALGNDLQNSPDPNAVNGIGPTELMKRKVGGDLTYLTVLTGTRDLLADAINRPSRAFTAFTDVSQAAGNRWGICVPTLNLTDHRAAPEQGFAAETVSYSTLGTNALAVILTMF